MAQRNEHLFEFTASAIAEQSRKEAEYHEERQKHYEERRDAARQVVEATIGAKIVSHEVTGGKRLQVVVDYGDREAWGELELCDDKVRSHIAQAQRFRSEQKVYSTQPSTRNYQLDADDVHYFRFGAEHLRED